MSELGVCLRSEPVADVVRVAEQAERLGYSELWLPDSARGAGVDDDGRFVGRDAFCAFSAMFAATATLRGAIGVAAVPMHTPPALACLASTLSEWSGGRFDLGVGVSHRELARQNGVEFPDSPLGYMRHAVDELRERSATGMAFGAGWPVLLAALGPKMVDLAIDVADGVVLNWLTPESTAAVVERARSADRPVRTVLYLRVMMPRDARDDAVAYDRLGNYHRHFVSQGLKGADHIAEATTVPADDIDRARARLDRYRETGADLICLYPVGITGAHREHLLTELAP